MHGYFEPALHCFVARPQVNRARAEARAGGAAWPARRARSSGSNLRAIVAAPALLFIIVHSPLCITGLGPGRPIVRNAAWARFVLFVLRHVLLNVIISLSEGKGIGGAIQPVAV